MGSCWSWECGSRPRCTGHYWPCCAGWVGPTVVLCIYGFCSMMRPVEPFMTEFLTGSYKNFTTEQVTRRVYPVWTYSNLVLIIPVFLVTDFLRYKPVIVLQGLCNVGAFLLVLVGSGVCSAQWAFFIYSLGTAADVGYFAYIYSVVQPSYYQRVTSYARGAILLGYAASALLGQLLVSLGGVSLYCLTVVTLIALCMALFTSIFLPMPKTSLFLRETYYARQGSSGEDTQSGSESRDSFIWLRRSRTAAKYAGRMLRKLILDCKDCYSSMAVLFFCIWSATGRCGFYQVSSYVQVLWVYKQPQHNFTAYNGGVDSVATLSGAAASIAVGHVSLEWCVWGELILGGFTLLIAGAVFLMALTNNIWLSYTCYMLFKTLYMQLITICTFQIARKLTRERYALVFGVNSFMGTVLQSVLTAVVINTKSLRLTITSQFFVYASYFAAIGLLFTVRGVYTALHRNQPSPGNQAERATHLPQGSRL
ncbi:thiamine transporter 2-like [Myripristis murdjan]|uniref:thiamine transporter 2-like n=1 Tax=Myripristis murdjan TaxID=586833 RepID=UPI001175D903|nr:thiamine transporter 2-like [Myripristis murdjan]